MRPFAHGLLLFLALHFTDCAVAGITTYEMLDMTNCAAYVTENSGGPDMEDPTPFPAKQKKYQDMINSLRPSKDPAWGEWTFYDRSGKPGGRYPAICKYIVRDNRRDEIESFQCIGDSRFPFSPALTCKFISHAYVQNNARCTIQGSPNRDVRLYWVDNYEYDAPNEGGSSGVINRQYEKDMARMKKRCVHRN